MAGEVLRHVRVDARRHGGSPQPERPRDKSAVYHSIDGSRETFSLRVIGGFPGTQEFWFASRALDLKGAAFNAEGMTIPDAMQGKGYGRDLMAVNRRGVPTPIGTLSY